jgi:thiamine-phosphate pyrophosphorylase
MGSVNCSKDPAAVLNEAIDGGITMFQFREKGSGALAGQEKWELGKRLRDICRQRGIPFLVNDDVELALELDADGVHIGQEDDPLPKVRERIGRKIIGVSAHDVPEARKAMAEGADYIGVGPMYPTATKSDAREVAGPSMIELMRRSGITLPLVGIGGIDLNNASAVMKAGADGIAVISAISRAASCSAAAKNLSSEVMKQIRNQFI